MYSWHRKYTRKIIVSFTGTIFLFSFFVSALFPEKAFAQVGGAVFDAPLFNQNLTFHIQEKVNVSIGQAIGASVLGAAVQGVSYFARKIAYDTALYVANGGKGQSALIFKKGWGDYLSTVAGDAAGAAVSELGKSWGLDLCHFPNINLQLYLELSLRQASVPTTDCSWSDLTAAYGKDAWVKRYENVKNTADRFTSQDKLLKEFGKAIRPGNSDFGISVGAILQVDRIKKEKKEAALQERTTNKGFKDLNDLISGNVKTPGDVIGQETQKQLSSKEYQRSGEISMAGIYGAGLYQVIPQTASMFLNTLGATLLQRLFSQGITGDSGSDGIASYYGSDPNVRNNAEAAQNAYNFLFTRTPKQATDYNNLAEFAACPDNPGVNNCVMDTGLQEALSRANAGTLITIADAIKPGVGLLNPNWPLISPRRERDHQDIRGCVSEKYCYSNLQKLRKARILPLGFEIAALRSDPDNPWTLGQVIAGFDDCNRPDPNNPSVVIPDPAKPFCHLINPNWVLKAPSARCEAQVFGDQLLSPDVATRREDCGDVSTCLAKDENGACIKYGYCTKEKNTWHIGVDICPAEFNTCTTYTNLDTRKVVSYLAKTVDYGECTIDNVGCRAYSLAGIGNLNAPTTSWQNSTDADANQVVYFNEKIKSLSTACSEKNDGCSAFYAAERLADGRYVDLKPATAAVDFSINKTNLEYIKKAPNYLGCYDVNKAAPGVQWPSTLLEANTVQNSALACDKFASACVKEEVGCEAFKAKNGGPTIPGKIGDNNYCAQVCVGYETFKQEPAPFEPSKFPVYFIPDQAKVCPSTANGCSEFTNIDAQSKGGEGLEYYTDLKYCEKPLPDNSNIKTYYSWEGSADNGYVLRTYQMKPLTVAIAGRAGFEVGSPAYILDTDDALNEYIGKCDETKYNNLLQGKVPAADADCRALFDNDGKTFYRLLAKTVTVDEACHPLRKTIPVFVRDPALAGKNACLAKDANWNEAGPGAAFCERCINGGKYQNGFCLYQTISNPKESSACAPEFNGCRAYTGNAVSNIRDVFFPPIDNFEPTGENADAFRLALEGWNGNQAQIVAESIHTGEHSLQVPGVVSRNIASSTMQTGAWYKLSFWAKTSQQNTPLNILFITDGFVQAGAFAPLGAPLNIGNSWQLYTLGPVQFTGPTDNHVVLTFSAQGNSPYFLDQVQLQRINDYKYYVKDSWKAASGNEGHDVPLACDSAPEDRLPGEALGCREYVDSANTSRYATGFQNLCREKAIGCQPVWDTFNTVDGSGAEQAQLFNVSCTGVQNTTCSAVHDGVDLGSCFIAPGLTYCYIPQIILPRGLTFPVLQNENNNRLLLSNSSVSIPADTSSTLPLFLAAGESIGGKPKYACDQSGLSCQKVGQEERRLPNTANTSFAFNDVFIKNDPASYKDTLCRNSLVGCSHYQSGGKETFFKDPEVTGNSLCTYQPKTEGMSSQYGWYLEKVGKCSQVFSVNGGPQVQGIGDQLCKVDTDCPVESLNNVPTQQRCMDIGSVACSPNNLRVGGFYDIWSNKSQNYTGNVGLCPASQNSCTEIIDRQDTSNVNPEGKPYYVLFNQKVEDKKKECTQVSLSEGCVLFDKTDEPNKVFDSTATYLRSEKKPGQPFGPVDPVQSGDPAFQNPDTNLLMKVDRDRECSEWLACQSYIKVMNPDGSQKFVCQKLSSCQKIGEGNTSDCAEPVDDLGTPEDTTRALYRLDYNKYITRKVSWYAEEFSGYSLYNKFQITNMVYVNFVPPEDLKNLGGMGSLSSKSYIAREISSDILIQARVDQNLTCVRDGVENTDWMSCGLEQGGMCYRGRCIYPIAGVFKQHVNLAADALDKSRQILAVVSELEGNICKGTPEADSPYPYTVFNLKDSKSHFVPGAVRGTGNRRVGKDNIDALSGANVCQAGACSCSYQKISYKGGTAVDYWPTDTNLHKDENGNTVSVAPGVCSGGKKDGYPCDDDRGNADCIGDPAHPEDQENNGTCQIQQKVDLHVGLEGFCLEYDLSRKNLFNNSYACLTWLPIQASAAPVDIYNSYSEASYVPTVDAGANGTAYCIAGTQMANKPYNTDIGLAPDYTTYFDIEDPASPDSPAPNISSEVNQGIVFPRTCGVDGSFPRLACGTQPEYMAKIMQEWAWNKLGRNSIVLRSETSAEVDDNNNTLFGVDLTDHDHAVVDYNNCLNCVPTSLAPVVGSQNDRRTIGTILHPPRVFDTVTLSIPKPPCQGDFCLDFEPDRVQFTIGSEEQLKSEVPAFDWFYYKSQATGEDGDVDITIHPAALSPGPYLLPTERQRDREPLHVRLDQSLYRAPFEGFLREKDLQRVYFIPTAFPGGMRNHGLPAWMTEDLYIDFLQLNKPNNAPVALTRKVYQANSCSSVRDGRNEVFPQRPGESDQCAEDSVGRVSNFWTYKLTRDGTGLLHYDDYSSLEHHGGQAFENGNFDPTRNQIATRYVGVYYVNDRDGQGIAPGFGEGRANCAIGVPSCTSNIPDVNTDPFTLACANPAGDTDQWFAIGMDFNADGEFLGYITKSCDNWHTNDLDSVGYQFTTIATLNDQCIEFADVYRGNNPLQETASKAWTNRLWSAAVESHPAPNYSALDRNIVTGLRKTTANLNFGSLSLDGQTLQNPSTISLRNYTFRYPTNDGVPYSCNQSVPFLSFVEQARNCDSLASRSRASQEDNFNYTDAALRPGLVSRLTGRSLQEAKDAIAQLFAKTFTLFKFNPAGAFNYGENNYAIAPAADVIPVDSALTAASALAGEALMPPQIYSLDPYTCESVQTCSYGEKNNMTINGRNGYTADNGTLQDYNGDGIADEDVDGNGKADALIQVGGTFYADMRFFAFADDNRMPIRRIQVDWNDGTDSIGKMGLYKNNKAVCDSNDEAGAPQIGLCVTAGTNTPTGATCLDTPDKKIACPTGQTCTPPNQLNTLAVPYQTKRFGNSTRACIPGFYQYIHEYSCGMSDLLAARRSPGGQTDSVLRVDNPLLRDHYDRLKLTGVVDTDLVCVYQPKVQVLDNWGWCNGQCTKTYADGQPVPAGVGEGCYGTSESGAGVPTNRGPGKDYQCDLVSKPGVNPWSAYKGLIIVVPSKQG